MTCDLLKPAHILFVVDIFEKLLNVHHDSDECDFLLFDSLCDKIILEKVCIIHIRTYIAYFFLLSPEPTL
jgi:hypothetical protein